MALTARLSVVGRAEPVLDELLLREDVHRLVEFGLGGEAVREVVETGRGLGDGLDADPRTFRRHRRLWGGIGVAGSSFQGAFVDLRRRTAACEGECECECS